MPCSTPSPHTQVAIPASRAPGRWVWVVRRKTQELFPRLSVQPRMKFQFTFSAMALLAGLLVVPSLVGAEQAPTKEGKKREPIAARTLLEAGRASASWPEGMVIRVSACLGEPDARASVPLPAGMKETWEFTSGQVHRVSFDDTNGKSTDHRVESRPFDSKGICKDLLEGKVIEIQAGKGEGPEVGLIGSHYHRGGRSIEVTWKGETILHLYETNGPFLKFYRQSDARAFGALYERLASQARILFQSKPAEAK